MNYWLINPKSDGSNTNLSDMKSDCIKMGWDEQVCPRFYYDVKANDIIIVAEGSHSNNRVHFIGIADKLNKEEHCWHLLYPTKDMNEDVEKIIRNNPSHFGGGESNNPWGPTRSIIQITNNNSAEEEIKAKLNTYFMKIKMKEQLKQYATLLSTNKNIILTGAPGTGKTYLAKEIAKALGATGEACKLVQFHPSYDYTDFVEGLRPLSDNNGNIGFERKDGIFKAFCAKALKYSFDKAYDKLTEDIRKGKVETIELKTKSSSKLSVTDGKNIHWYSETEVNNISSNAVSRLRLKNLYKQYYTLEKLKTMSNIQSEVKDVIGGCDATYYWGVLHYLLEQYIKPFVFIIDEINRGEISKIFGELFYSIDPGYRGRKGKVNTQYQNLIPKEEDKDFNPNSTDAFRNGFYVPENVYIIGTMNDIDRSVESMDFAFRRRFAFMEIKADENTGMLDSLKWKDEAIERMKRLNTEIEKIEGLSSAYHIGASYFLKLENYNGDFGKLWEYHLKGLLFEYLRGMQSVDKKLEQLKAAYENESNPNN